MMLRNPALERMRSGEAALGMIVRLARTGDIAMIAGASGHDFVFLDIQHTAMSSETAASISLAALGCAVTPIVRVLSCEDLDAARILDAGATGICVPDVETAEQARRAVEICKFPPQGRRSVSAGYPAFGYRNVPAAEAAQSLNQATVLVVMVETRKGIENAEAIAGVDGVDVLHIGCSDLLSDMGKPGQYGDPEVVAAIERVLAACRKHGKFAGLGGDRDPARQARFIQEGGRFLTTNSDVAFLTAEATRRTEALRAAIKQATKSVEAS
jgi:2-keto-3-deoxy-L-rhamnonate aldolase RhmA